MKKPLWNCGQNNPLRQAPQGKRTLCYAMHRKAYGMSIARRSIYSSRRANYWWSSDLTSLCSAYHCARRTVQAYKEAQKILACFSAGTRGKPEPMAKRLQTRTTLITFLTLLMKITQVLFFQQERGTNTLKELRHVMAILAVTKHCNGKRNNKAWLPYRRRFLNSRRSLNQVCSLSCSKHDCSRQYFVQHRSGRSRCCCLRVWNLQVRYSPIESQVFWRLQARCWRLLPFVDS